MIKKFYAVLLTASFTLLMIGCNTATSNDNKVSDISSTTSTASPTSQDNPISSEASVASSTTEVSEVPETSTTELEGEYKESILNFLESLKNKDSVAASNTLGILDTSYEFLNDLEISSYTVTRRMEDLDQRFSFFEQYDVTLNVEKSSDPIIPTGTSQWLIVSPGNATEIGLFIPEERIQHDSAPTNPDVPLKFAEYSQLYNSATTFTLITECFDTESMPLDQIQLNTGMLHKFMHAAPTDSDFKLTIPDFKNYIQNTYGLTINENVFQNYVDQMEESELLEGENHQTINVMNCGHGSNWYTTSLEDAKSVNDHEVAIEVQYYADCSCFYPAKKVTYNFIKNSTDTWQLSSVKTTEDTGYTPQIIGV